MADSHSDARQWCFTAGGPVLRPGAGLSLALGPQRAPVCWGRHGLEVLGRGSPGVVVRLHRTGASDDVLRAGESLAVEVDGRGFMAGSPGTCAGAVSFGTDPAATWTVQGVPRGSALPSGAHLALVDLHRGACLVAHDGHLAWSPLGPGLPSPARSTPTPGEEGDPSFVTVVGQGHLGRDGARVLRAATRGGPVEVPDPLPSGVPSGASWWLVGRPGPAVPTCGPRAMRSWLALAWAESAGTAVRTCPTGPGWPDATMRWRVVRPATDGGPVVLHLPLPSDDAAPGTSTTWRAEVCTPGDPAPLITLSRSDRSRRDLRVALPGGGRGTVAEYRIDVVVHRRT